VDKLQAAYARLDEFIRQKMENSRTPGMAVVLTDAGNILRITTYGYANLEAKIPVTPETLFEIGSDGKTFTAIAIMQQVEAGKIDLHAPVTQYLPWFEVKSRYEPITIHHLLNHTAGISSGSEAMLDARPEVFALRETETAFPPGQHYQYSDLGYKALGLVLESVLQKPYPEIIQENIFEPLGMSNSAPAITNALRDRLATGYVSAFDDRPFHFSQFLTPAPWLETATGDGSIASTPADMGAFYKALLRRGEGLLSKESFEKLIEPGIEMWSGVFYGYGISSSTTRGYTSLMHGGDMPGFESVLSADLDNGLAAWVGMNGPLSSGIANYALNLLRAVYLSQELPDLPEVPDPTVIENASDYAGEYRAGEETFTVAAEGRKLYLHCQGTVAVLEKRDEDSFYSTHPTFALFPLKFGRDEAEKVVEAYYGATWYTTDRYWGETNFSNPENWKTFAGHYRAHNPWHSNFRIILRKGALLLVWPSGEETPLTPLGDNIFRVGEEEFSPERLRFEAVVEGQALRANLSGGDYYRFFTP